MSARLLSLKSRIGGRVSGMRGVFPGPAHSGRDTSLSLWDLGERVLVFSFAGDSHAEIAGYLRGHGVEIVSNPKDLTRGEKRKLHALQKQAREEEAREQARKRRQALALYQNAMPLGGVAADYLRGRGISEPVIAAARGADLRFAAEAPLSPYSPGLRTQPAMLGLVTAPHGEPLGLHMTFLLRDSSGKAGEIPRLMLAKQSGGMIRLSAPAETLAIAEGVETALSYTTLFGIPCWAARSAIGLEQFRPPEGVRRVIIAADADAAGTRAADTLASVLRAYVKVEIHAPPVGNDFNDHLREAV